MSTSEITGFDPAAIYAAATGEKSPAPARSERQQNRQRGLIMETRVRPRGHKWYSRFVHMMKILLPVVAALLIVLILVWPYLRTEDLRFRLSFAALNANQNEDPSMVNPRYLGIDKENQAYSVTADLARKLAADGSGVELEMPKADITLNDGTWLVLTAKNGVFKQTKSTLDLTGAVNLFHDSGYEFQTSQAEIDLEKGLAKGSAAVRGQGPFGELQGEGFRLIDKGKTIVFTGKSKLVIYPGAEKPVQ
ncbi:MAG: LPS export ABC transporter periplasmic protein LptC [Rhodospirillales bacterium]|nr:LPS export ABC transporter periplasmic protein LptC [Rhodospirillales bacterium]